MVVQGILLCDFGDMMCISVSLTEEDGVDDNKIILNTDFSEVLYKGLSVMNPVMTEAEKAHIVDGAKYMIFIIGIRFLADYSNNDIYFKTSYPEENYTGTCSQFVLLQRSGGKEAELKIVVKKYSK